MGEAGGDDHSSARLPSARLVVWGLTALLAVPLVVALLAAREPRWLPMSDHAEYEMYVRDVPSAHPPLVGLTGRMFAYGEPGAHPGPIGFYLLWPLYRLLGTDGWSLQAATAALVAAATGLSIWLAHRRGGWPFALATTASLALLLWGYGARILLETWNPHLPLLWWVVFLLAVWSVLCDDLKMLPVVALAGSVCAQTHVSYVPLVGGLTLLVAGTLVVRLLRSRSVAGEEARRLRRHVLAWAGGSAALAGVLWLPPLVEELRNRPGNLSIVLENFQNDSDQRVAFGDAVTMWLDHMDVTALVTSALRSAFPYENVAVNWIGVLVLGIWAGAAVVAWRQGDAVLRRLHLVVGVAVALGLLSMSRISGPPWPYLSYWAWGTTALLVLATTWTLLVVGTAKAAGFPSPTAAAAAGVLPQRPTPLAQPQLRPAGAVLAATTLLLVGLVTIEAADVEMTEPALSQTLEPVVSPTVDWLQHDPGPCGDDCRVLVTWTDEVTGGVQALGLIVALEREGIDARAVPALADHVRHHRTSRPSAIDLEVRLVVSQPAIAIWHLRPDTELVASAQPTDQTAEPVAVFVQPAGASARNEARR
jgi:hypothetical protein